MEQTNQTRSCLFGTLAVITAIILLPQSLFAQPKIKDEFPRLGLMLIGGQGHRYHEADYQQQLARFDLVVLGMYPGWNKGGQGSTPNEKQSSVLRQIKALNPDIVLANYSILLESPDHVTGAYGDVFNKVSKELGPIRNGGTYMPNDWWARTSSGANMSPWSGTWKVNITDHVTPDANGDTYPEWFAKRNYEQMFKNVPEWDAIYHDGVRYKPRRSVDWDRDGVDNPIDDWETQRKYRAAMVRQWQAERGLMPGMLMIGNIGTWGQSIVVDYGKWVLTEFDQELNGGFLEKYMGKFWSLEQRWSWEAMMRSYRETLARTAAPKLILLNAGDGDRDGIGYYQYFRYGFASTLLDNGYFDFSDADIYADIYWFDEYDLAGKSTTRWLGKALDVPQHGPWSNGVYRRRFVNGMVLVNPRGNGTRTVQIEAGYSRIKGIQDPVTNNGQPVTTVTINERDGLILVRDGGELQPPAPKPPTLTAVQ